jgi:hypothetical protein
MNVRFGPGLDGPGAWRLVNSRMAEHRQTDLQISHGSEDSIDLSLAPLDFPLSSIAQPEAPGSSETLSEMPFSFCVVSISRLIMTHSFISGCIVVNYSSQLKKSLARVPENIICLLVYMHNLQKHSGIESS